MSCSLAVTLGDPAGIGPEICAAALGRFLVEDPRTCATVFGPSNLLTSLSVQLPSSRLRWRGQAPFAGVVGEASAAGGAAALSALAAAIEHVQGSDGPHALVTAPINKHALRLAGSPLLGHTELLQRHLGRGPVAMAFFTKTLSVALVTDHMPLRQVFAALEPGRVVAVGRLLSDALRPRLGRQPRLALAGINPHAGEEGLLGDEERTVLVPAAQQARAAGIDLSDPIAPDTVFYRSSAGEFDGVLALYHDQGLIPVKLQGFDDAVHVTLGLRVVRTSPDHGTAFDRAGRGTARPHGMLGAMHWARRLCEERT